MASHFKIRTEKTGHYFMHGSITPSTKYVWICLHGYGQLAKHFIKRFEFLDTSDHVVIAPEGLNRFYFEGLNDRPVATWMTSEDRLDEIADFIGFLESLRQKLAWDKNGNTKIIYLGFSQGVTSLLRWLVDRTPPADYLLCWAGGLPDDLLFHHRKNYFSQIQSHFFLGDKDQYFELERVEKVKLQMASKGLEFNIHYYHGVHKVDDNVLEQWIKRNLEK